MSRKIVLIVSLVLALVAALLTRFYISSKEKEVADEKARIYAAYGTIYVLAYTHDVAAGTVLSSSDVTVVRAPRVGLQGHAVEKDDLTMIAGKKTLVAHKANEVVNWSDLEGGGTNGKGLAGSIERQMRAISINVNASSSVAGMVRPNDHVDVIGTYSFPDAEGRTRSGEVITSTILQNVLVLATGRDTAKSLARETLGGQGSGYSTVTLQVTPREAEVLAFTEQMKGRLILTLRNRNDTSYERELPKIDFEKIRGEIEELNLKRQQKNGVR